MNQTIIKNLLFLCTSCVILNAGLGSCTNPEPKPVKDLGFIPLGESRDYLAFKPGSYWIYRYSETGELDTIIRQFLQIDTLHSESSLRKFDFEQIAYSDHSQTFGYNYNHSSQPLNADVTDFQWIVNIRSSKNDGTRDLGTSTMFFFPFVENKATWAGSGTCTFINTDSLTINSVFYPKVSRFDLEADAMWYEEKNKNPRTSYFWVSEIGLVKREVNDNRFGDFGSWDLIESNVIK